MYLAIDFGTSNTKAALVIEGQLILVRDPFKPESSFFPSSVYLTGEGKILVGHAADGMRNNDIHRYRKEFKRDLGVDIPYQLGDRQLLPQDLLAAVLSQIKQEVEKIVQSHGENSLTSVVLTVPVNYGDYKKRLMWKVAEQVGFTDVQFLPEPEAAAYYYNRNNIISNGNIVLVYDLGGGTFDAALLRKEGDGYKSLVPPTGIDGCGGIDFDRQIYRRIYEQIKDPVLVQSLKSSHNDVRSQQDREILGDFCRSFKHQLSQVSKAFSWLVLDREMYELTQEDFNLMIESVIDETVVECLGLVKDANLKVDELNHVLLIGGSCRIPYVRELLEAKLTKPLFHLQEPDLAVCQGAVLFASGTTTNLVVKTTAHGKSQSKRAKVSTTNKIKANVKTKIIGFNLGHGETSLHWTWDYGTDSRGKSLEPLKVEGQPESFITAIGYDDNQNQVIAIGEKAFCLPKSYNIIDICFKARLDNIATQKKIKDYVQYIYSNLVDKRLIDANQDYQILFYVGHPSGWEKENINLYQEIMAEVLPNVKVAPESRAGLMSVINTNQVTLEDLGKFVLVIDIGSSTTDFTLVGSQLNQPFVEAGADLGGALIDEAIYEHSLAKLQKKLEEEKKEAKERLENMEEPDEDENTQEKELMMREKLSRHIQDPRKLNEAVKDLLSPDKSGTQNKQKKALEDLKKELNEKICTIEELKNIFAPESNHLLKSIAKLRCREVKDRYFSGAYLPTLSFAVKGEFSFEPINNKKQLEKIINQKFKELGNKTWAEVFRQKLENVKNKLDSQNREPGALFLTGRASRMGVIQNVCEELFPNTKFVRDSQPEICISRGLALWGKTDYKVAGFLETVEEFIEKYLPEVIQIKILSFEDSLGEFLCEKMHKFIMESIIANRSKRIFMGDEEKKLINNYKKWLQEEVIKETMPSAINDWAQHKLFKDINEELQKIFKKYNLDEKDLKKDILIMNNLVRINIENYFYLNYNIQIEKLQALEIYKKTLSLEMLTIILLPITLKTNYDHFLSYESKFELKSEIKKCLKLEPEAINKIVEQIKKPVRELVHTQANKLKLLIL